MSASHGDADWGECVENLDGVLVVLQHFWKSLVGLRSLVGVSAAQRDVLSCDPLLHHLDRDLARRPQDAGLPVPLPAR